jgi:hypothetical protein
MTQFLYRMVAKMGFTPSQKKHYLLKDPENKPQRKTLAGFQMDSNPFSFQEHYTRAH